MTSIPTLDNPTRRRPSATAVSPAKSSQPTSPGRSPSCESDIQTLRSSATSDQDSTSGAKAYLPYWNDYTREISSVLWSPTETVLQGLGRNSSLELIETLLERNGGELVVLNQRDLSPEEELTTDLLAILTVFGARVNGLRRYRKEIKEDKALPRRTPEG